MKNVSNGPGGVERSISNSESGAFLMFLMDPVELKAFFHEDGVDIAPCF